MTNSVNTHPFFALTADLGPMKTITASELKTINFNPRASFSRIRDSRKNEPVFVKPANLMNVLTSLDDLKDVLLIAMAEYNRLKMGDITSLLLISLPEQSMKAQERKLPTEMELSQFQLLLNAAEKTSSDEFFSLVNGFTTDHLLFMAELYNSEIERIIRDLTLRLNIPVPEEKVVVARTDTFPFEKVMRETHLKDIREMFPQVYPVFDSLVLREYKIDRTLMDKEESWNYSTKQGFIQSLYDYGIFGQVFLYDNLSLTILLNGFRRFEALKDFLSGEFPIKVDDQDLFFVENPELFTNVLMRIVFPVTTLSFGTNMTDVSFGENELTTLQRSIQQITP